MDHDVISHVLNEQWTRHEYPISIELKNVAYHLKERTKISKFESYWFKCKG